MKGLGFKMNKWETVQNSEHEFECQLPSIKEHDVSSYIIVSSHVILHVDKRKVRNRGVNRVSFAFSSKMFQVLEALKRTSRSLQSALDEISWRQLALALLQAHS